MASLSDNSIKQYSSSIKHWFKFCQENFSEFRIPNKSTALQFLAWRDKEGDAYSTLGSHRSALSLLSVDKIGEDAEICRFLKGVFRAQGPRPKYQSMWDVADVLDFLKGLDSEAIQSATKKTVLLLALATAQRPQTLSAIETKNMQCRSDGIYIYIQKILKTSNPNREQPTLFLPFFEKEPQLCVASTLLKYLKITNSIRETDHLFVSLKKPHKEVSSQTISRWIKNALKEAGIDTETYSAYSTRHASTSKAFSKELDIESIKKAAHWTPRSQVFAKFYNVPIEEKKIDKFAETVLL